MVVATQTCGFIMDLFYLFASASHCSGSDLVTLASNHSIKESCYCLWSVRMLYIVMVLFFSEERIFLFICCMCVFIYFTKSKLYKVSVGMVQGNPSNTGAMYGDIVARASSYTSDGSRR